MNNVLRVIENFICINKPTPTPPGRGFKEMKLFLKIRIVKKIKIS
jgi:hypothetical protein